LDLAFASELAVAHMANVKSTPLAVENLGKALRPCIHAAQEKQENDKRQR